MAFPMYLYFYLIFILFALILHLLVTSFIILQRYQKNKTYASSFYLLYIFSSFSDMINLINTIFMSKITLYESLHPWFRSHTMYITACFLISGYCLFSQAIFHVAIAINRVWVSIFLIKKGPKIMKKFGTIFIWFLPILALIILGPFFASPMVYMDLEPPNLFAYYTETWVRSYHSVIGPTIVLSSSAISFTLTIFTILRYRQLLKQHNSDTPKLKREIYLLTQAAVTLFFEILVGCYFGCIIIANTYDFPLLLTIAFRAADYIFDLSCLINPIALLVVCKFVRLDFQQFFFGRVTKVIDISGGNTN